MTYLSADEILGAHDLPTEDVDVPEWGGTVRVQGLTGAERDRFESQILAAREKTKTKSAVGDLFRARLAAACIVDESGKRLFQGDAVTKRLGEKSAVALTRVVEVASRLSGLSEEDRDELTGN